MCTAARSRMRPSCSGWSRARRSGSFTWRAPSASVPSSTGGSAVGRLRRPSRGRGSGSRRSRHVAGDAPRSRRVLKRRRRPPPCGVRAPSSSGVSATCLRAPSRSAGRPRRSRTSRRVLCRASRPRRCHRR
ncbi:hypothetical protein ACFPRL_27790 [Pseudoclavibacter helvolus]